MMSGMSGDASLLSCGGYADPYGSNLTLSSSTSSAIGFAQDGPLSGGNLLNISQKSSRSSSMSRYSN